MVVALFEGDAVLFFKKISKKYVFHKLVHFSQSTVDSTWKKITIFFFPYLSLTLRHSRRVFATFQ